jgi:hypothetical protein
MRRRVALLAVVVLVVLGAGTAIWASRDDDCEPTTVSVSDPGSPRTMKVHRKAC